MYSYFDSKATCPFYRGIDPLRIKCEGCFKETLTALIFKNNEDRKTVLEKHCCNDYEHCPLYSVVSRKYET